MEPLTMFASSIGIIGIFHLVSTAVNRFGKGIYGSNQQNKRDDWYCFFKLSDLLGAEVGADNNKKRQEATVFEAEHLKQKRRQQENRPRLQV